MRVIGKTNDAALEGPAVLGTGTLAQARYLPSGHVVYGQSPGIVRAAPFDLAAGRFTGPVASVVASVERSRNQGAVYFAVSATGLLAYAPTGYRHQIVWVDRSGAATPISPDRASFRYPRVSPDGSRLAVAVNDETRRGDLWIYDAQLGTKRRLTTERHNGWPLWTRDGRNITFTSGGIIHEVPADGSGPPRVLVERGAAAPYYPTSWSPDGRELLFEVDDVVSSDVAVIAPHAGEARLLLSGPFNERDAQFSPDGRYVAYRSDESGRAEVYVASYPSLEGRTAISTDGGTVPRWSRDGRELFFRQGDAIMAANVDTRGGFRSERPRRLFAGSYDGEGRHGAYDVSPDGRRFVLVKDDEASSLRELSVVQGWFEELRRLAPASR
jgi:serine/threonine-protein kinase